MVCVSTDSGQMLQHGLFHNTELNRVETPQENIIYDIAYIYDGWQMSDLTLIQKRRHIK